MTADVTSSTEFFGSHADRWVRLYESKATFKDRLALFSKALGRVAPRGGRILDFGCGPGVMAIRLAERGYCVLGTDGSREMIATAMKERARLGIRNVEFAVVDASDVALEPQSFDAVICSSVIEYVEDDAGLVRSLIGLLRPGGHLLVSIPHTASVIGRIEHALEKTFLFASRPGGQHLGFSRRRYRRHEFLSALRSMGLDSLECTTFEVPILGRPGVIVSRCRWVGVMLLVVGRKVGRSVAVATTGGSGSGSAARAPRALSRKNVWDSMPRRLRGALGRPLSLLPQSILFGRPFMQQLSFVDRAQWWSAQEARTYQLAQLVEICRLAQEQSPYYQRVFSESDFDFRALKNTEDLAALPTLDRDTVREHLEEMRTVPRDARGVDRLSTGGTGGVPLHFYIGAERSAIEYAHLVSSWRRVGYDLSMPLAVLRGRAVGTGSLGFPYEYDPVLRHHYYSSFDMTDANMGRYLEHIGGLGEVMLHVYPSTVAMLARYMRRRSMAAPPNVRGIIAESEIVYPEQRRVVEEVFGCRYFSCFGHSEKAVAAAECEHSTDYHVWPTYGVCEVLDKAGERVTEPGRRGEIVATGFINRVVPFIRYRTGDYVTYVGERCDACGREHMILRDIRGHRTQEVLVASDGTLVPWAALNMHDATFIRVRQFQFLQTRAGEATLRLVPGTGFSDVDETDIRRALDSKLTGRVRMDIEVCDEIPLTSDGKSIYVDQRIDGVQHALRGDENCVPCGVT